MTFNSTRLPWAASWLGIEMKQTKQKRNTTTRAERLCVEKENKLTRAEWDKIIKSGKPSVCHGRARRRRGPGEDSPEVLRLMKRWHVSGRRTAAQTAAGRHLSQSLSKPTGRLLLAVVRINPQRPGAHSAVGNGGQIMRRPDTRRHLDPHRGRPSRVRRRPPSSPARLRVSPRLGPRRRRRRRQISLTSQTPDL